MSFHTMMEVFPSDTPSLQEKMLRLRQQIIEAQLYRRKLDAEHSQAKGRSLAVKSGDRLYTSYWNVEKQIADLRIWEMESRLTALLDIQGD